MARYFVASERRDRSRLIMVDNVVSGERWVASGLTFDYAPVARRSATNCSRDIGRGDTRLAARILEASDDARRDHGASR